MTANFNQNSIIVYRGDDFGTQLVFTDSNNDAINITGWKIFFTVKKNQNDPDAKAVISVTIDPTDPIHGIADVFVSHTITDVLLGTYYYDFQFTNATGVVTTITSGDISFEKDITRRTS